VGALVGGGELAAPLLVPLVEGAVEPALVEVGGGAAAPPEEGAGAAPPDAGADVVRLVVTGAGAPAIGLPYWST
jgi:hypothetical protein